jgi:hypothetical protein
MPEQILDGTGSGYMVAVTSDGRMKVDLGGDVTISGVNIDSIILQETSPIDSTKNNPAFQFGYIVSGTATGVIGSRIGSVVMFIGAGSFVNNLEYSNNRITKIGSWV